MADYETILTERVGNVLKITLNRPDRLNAASIPLAEELGAAFYDLDGARAVLITGAGKGFCSGADLAARGEQSAVQAKGGSHRALQNFYNPLVSQILRCPVPVVSAVNGAAAGVGCSIALAGDFVLAAKSAYFSSLRQHRPRPRWWIDLVAGPCHWPRPRHPDDDAG